MTTGRGGSEGGRAIVADLFSQASAQAPKPLTVFHAELITSEQTSWEELFAGFNALRAAGFATDALRQAAALGAELKDLVLPKDKAGRTVANAASVLRVIRSHQSRPLADGPLVLRSGFAPVLLFTGAALPARNLALLAFALSRRAIIASRTMAWAALPTSGCLSSAMVDSS